MVTERRPALLPLLATLAGGCADDDGAGEPLPQGWNVTLEVDESVGAFFSAWGPSPDVLYAVASQRFADGTTTGALYTKRGGVQWQPAELPADTPGLNWVFGVDDERFAVGEDGVILQRTGDDPTQPWTATSCGTALPLWGAWGATASDLWAVGGDGRLRDPVLCHYDGAAWAMVALPDLSVRSRGLFKVWGTSADHVFAVGDAGLILHYDGAAWTEQSSGTESDIIALWGTAPDEILAVGGRSGGVLVRYDGGGWTAQPQADLQGLNGIWMDDGGQATIAGALGTIASVPRGALAGTVEPSDTFLALHAVFSSGDGHTYAVGGSLDNAPPFTGVIVEHVE